ncbi:hypothetical protein K0M31_009193 [Melipona bicolor]|uniref:Uncharacterized protein n=1 Tax=Melipona bicolor TaxID=60889 RepID=A0AA40FP31_9HYME|nr:hypothetical protein K0M31_009193 [Melipona bicolor]
MIADAWELLVDRESSFYEEANELDSRMKSGYRCFSACSFPSALAARDLGDTNSTLPGNRFISDEATSKTTKKDKMKTILLFLSISWLATCLATPLEKLDKISVLEQQSVTLTDRAKYEEELLRKLNSKCSQNDISSCVMLKLVTYMNKLLKKASIELTDDIEIRKTSQASEEVITFEAGRSNDDESEVLDLVANKVYAFIKSRSIKWRILPEDDVVVSASEDENGSLNLGLSIERADNVPVQDGRGKKNNNMGPLIAAAVLKIGLIGGLAFKALALLVGKALLLSKIALLLAGIIGLKKLFSQQKHVTYEVVAHPHHSSSHISDHAHGDSYSSGWARSFHGQGPISGQADAHDLAYSAHAK